MNFLFLRALWIPAAFIILFLTAIVFRPLLPVDETRYLTVAWEMFLNQGWLEPLTLNFEPYHHKPPMLFWLINLSWAMFGVSQWAAVIPVVLASLTSVSLTAALGRRLLPPDGASRVPFFMIGSLPFLLYSTLILFDLTLTVFVLATLLCLLTYAERRSPAVILLMGLMLGFGVLTKGPAAYLHVIFPMVLGALWVRDLRPLTWYGGCLLAVLISFIPVFIWLVPVLNATDNHFAFWLVWEQSAGRVTGNFSDSHPRPFYFYLPLLPLFFLPWIFFPGFWRGVKDVRKDILKNPSVRFLLCWAVPVFAAFSMISGKQPHYLVPLIPAAVIAAAGLLRDTPPKILAATVATMLAIFVTGHAIASRTVFTPYDLTPVTAYISEHPGRDLAFVRKYHGEVTFLARLDGPVANLQMDAVDDWFKEHPNGMAIIRYRDAREVTKYRMLVDMPYTGRRLGIFVPKNP